MEQTTLTLMIRGVIALSLIAGGVFALFIGRRLYLEGIGLAPEGTVIQTQGKRFNLKASLKTVGTVVMVTSVLWGFLGYLALPSLGSETMEKINYEKGFEDGRTASDIFQFMNLYQEKLLAMSTTITLVKKAGNETALVILKSTAQGLVDVVKERRELQKEFGKLLNGTIDELDAAIKRNDFQKVEESILILQQTYASKFQAIMGSYAYRPVVVAAFRFTPRFSKTLDQIIKKLTLTSNSDEIMVAIFSTMTPGELLAISQENNVTPEIALSEVMSYVRQHVELGLSAKN